MNTKKSHAYLSIGSYRHKNVSFSKSLLYALLVVIFCQTQIFSNTLPITFDRIYSTDGLSNNSVRAVAQDKNGFIWLGTNEGLNRYDGIEFTIYKSSLTDPESISSNLIMDLTFDSQGYGWIATDDGLNRWDPQTDRFTRFMFDADNPGKQGVNFILKVYEDSQGRIWIGTVNGLHVYSYETNSFESFFSNPDDPSSLSYSHINCIYEDFEGTIWIATHGKGMNRLNDDGKTFIQISPDRNNLTSTIPWAPTCIIQDSNNRYWVGTWDKGVLNFNPNDLTFSKLKGIPDCIVQALQIDNSGNLWIGTMGEGLYQYNPTTDRYSVYQNDPTIESSLSSNRVYSFFQDRNDLFWVGVEGGGVNTFRLPETQIQHYQPSLTSPTSHSDKSVISILEDDSGVVWIGRQEKGLDRYDPKTGEYKNYIYATESKRLFHDLIIVNQVYSLLQMDDGRILLATIGWGPIVFDPATEEFTYFYDETNVSLIGHYQSAKDVIRGPSGQYWVCNDDGRVFSIDSTNHVTRIYGNGDDKFQYSRLTVLAFNDDGHLWVGAESEGLHLLDIDTGEITHFSHDPDNPASLSNDTIWDILKDSRGQVWIGTNEGLNQYVPETGGFELVKALQPYPSQAIMGIVEDESGSLWIGTNRGLIRYDPQRNTTKWYGLHNGIQGYEFIPKSRCAGKNGKMYFGGRNGFNIIDTETFQDYPSNSPVVLSKIQVNGDAYVSNRRVWDIDSIELPYNRNNIELLFSLLDYAAPSRNKLEYRIGESQVWQSMNQTQEILFADLSPGVRKIQIRGTNADGAVSPNVKEFTISILPPFWMTSWFRILLVILFLGALFAAYKKRMRRIKKENKRLEEEVANRTAVLELERDYFRSTIQASPLMIFGFTPNGILTFLNPTAESILQTKFNQLIGKQWWRITSNPVDIHQMKELHDEVQQRNIYDRELELQFLRGKPRTLVWNFIQRISESGQLTDVLAFGDDITERKRMEEQLLRQSNEDGLTQIANRRCFDRSLQNEWNRAQRESLPISICLLDIDYFKKYNDEYGHLEGDSCLQQVAATLQNQVNRPADLAARFGGEEFVVLLPNTDNSGALLVAERIRQQIENQHIPHQKSTISNHVTVSVGLATIVPNQDSTMESVLSMADRALYKAKEQGRNKIVNFEEIA